MILTKIQLIAHLDDMRRRVAAGDSLEGSISYLIPEDGGEVGEVFEVAACYRIGNLDGQGGVQLIHATPTEG